MTTEDLKSFLSNSISDIQGTIRAIDTKLSFLLAFILAPLAAMPTIIRTIINQKDHHVLLVLVIISVLLWLLTIYIISLGLTSVDNPSNKIKSTSSENTYEPQGLFYSGNLFGGIFNIRNSICSPKDQISRRSLNEHFSNLSNTAIELSKELAFEQMKLCYIRDIKIYRQRCALKVAFSSGVISLITITYYILIRMNP